jgi:hypothetical protein
MLSHCCLCLCVSVFVDLRIIFRMSEPVFIQLGVYNTLHELISTVHFINPSQLVVCRRIPPIVAAQMLGKLYPSF